MLGKQSAQMPVLFGHFAVLFDYFARRALDLGAGFDAREFALPEPAFELLEVLLPARSGPPLVVADARQIGLVLRCGVSGLARGFCPASVKYRLVCSK